MSFAAMALRQKEVRYRMGLSGLDVRSVLVNSRPLKYTGRFFRIRELILAVAEQERVPPSQLHLVCGCRVLQSQEIDVIQLSNEVMTVMLRATPSFFMDKEMSFHELSNRLVGRKLPMILEGHRVLSWTSKSVPEELRNQATVLTELLEGIHLWDEKERVVFVMPFGAGCLDIIMTVAFDEGYQPQVHALTDDRPCFHLDEDEADVNRESWTDDEWKSLAQATQVLNCFGTMYEMGFNDDGPVAWFARAEEKQDSPILGVMAAFDRTA